MYFYPIFFLLTLRKKTPKPQNLSKQSHSSSIFINNQTDFFSTIMCSDYNSKKIDFFLAKMDKHNIKTI